MRSNLAKKSLFIAAVILLCLYGVLGLPTSMGALRQVCVEQKTR